MHTRVRRKRGNQKEVREREGVSGGHVVIVCAWFLTACSWRSVKSWLWKWLFSTSLWCSQCLAYSSSYNESVAYWIKTDWVLVVDKGKLSDWAWVSIDWAWVRHSGLILYCCESLVKREAFHMTSYQQWSYSVIIGALWGGEPKATHNAPHKCTIVCA